MNPLSGGDVDADVDVDVDADADADGYAHTYALHQEEDNSHHLRAMSATNATLCNLPSSFSSYSSSFLHGMGLFGESYLLFSIGTLRPIWELIFPECFTYDVCSPRLLNSLTYSVVLGVIYGMLLIGYLANVLGRRKGAILTASLMSGGAIGLLGITYLPSPQWVFGESILLFLFGVGVGGEYPLSASSSAERSMNTPSSTTATTTASTATAPLTMTRGRQVQLVFSMQGAGIWCNSFVLVVLIWWTGQSDALGNNNNNNDEDNYDVHSLMIIWRITYLIGAIILSGVLFHRLKYLEESAVWLKDQEQQQQRQQEQQQQQRMHQDRDLVKDFSVLSLGKKPALDRTVVSESLIPDLSDVSSLSNPTVAMTSFDLQHGGTTDTQDREQDRKNPGFVILLKYYGMRLFGASASWFLWDVAFYGNKLFQSRFLLALTGDQTTLMQFTLCALLNSTIALVGYFGAAFLIDLPCIGRVRLQSCGFLVTGCLFLFCGFAFNQLSNTWLVVSYLLSTLFGQLGPNATTFLIPAEIFPTEMRTQCHGICAASGKVGALIASIYFNFVVADTDFFLLCGYSCFLGALVTAWTIPESGGMNIAELDVKWRMTLQGEHTLYRGDANKPEYCSMHENWRRASQRPAFFEALETFHDVS